MMTLWTMVEALTVLMITDIGVGLLVALKDHRLSSAIGRSGFQKKMSELLVMVAFALVSQLDQTHFPESLLSALYLYLLGFEILSIIENCDKMGIDLGFIAKYFKK